MDSGNIKTAEDVFKKCGIEYVHSNQKVVGGSHIEDHVSKVAQRDVFEIGQFSQEPAYCQVPTLDMETVTSHSKPKPAHKKTPSSSRVQSHATSHRLGDTTLLIGQTPIGVRRDQFKDMASILDFSSPSALANHIQGLSDEACLKLLLSYHQSKHGMDFDEFIKLPAKPSKDSKLTGNTRTGKERGEKQEPTLDETRGRGQGKGRRRDSRTKRREVKPGSRGRKAAVGLDFDSSSSDDDSLHIDSDDMEGTRQTVKRSNSRMKYAKLEREMEKGRRKRRSGAGMISHEVYQEIFDDEMDDDFSDELGAGYDVAKIHRRGAGNRCSESSAHEDARKRSKIQSSTVDQESDVKHVVQHPHLSNKGPVQQESKGVVSSTTRRKREDSLSFLDDIFLSDAPTSRRRPPPKKHVPRRDKSVTMATSESDSIFGAESITDDSCDLLSKAVVTKDKHYENNASPGSTGFTRRRVPCTFETDIVMETVDSEDADLWKRNETFLPRQTYFEESEESEDSESLFVANPKFKSGSGAIT